MKELAYQALVSQFQSPNLGFESITDIEMAPAATPNIPSPTQEFTRAATPTIGPFEPTMRQRLSAGAQKGLEALGMRRPQARSVSQSIFGGPSSALPVDLGVADVVPFLGTAMQTEEAGMQLKRAGQLAEQGEMGQAALETGMGLLGLVPGAAGTVQAARPIARQIRALGPIDEAKKIGPFSALQKDANELLSRNEPLQILEPSAAPSVRPPAVPGGQPNISAPAAGIADPTGRLASVQYVQLPSGDFATSTALSEAKRINVGFDRAATPEQAAHITAGLRKSPQEQLVALVVDENDNPIQIIRHTIGLSAQTSAEPFSFLGAIANTPGAKGYWISHNHPSGMATLSTADKRLTDAFEQLSANTGIENRGILAIGKDQFAFYNPKTREEVEKQRIPPAVRNKPLSIMERVFKKTNTLDSTFIQNNSQARAAAQKIAGNETGVMLLNNQNQPVAFVPLKDKDFSVLRETGIAKDLFGSMEKANAKNAIFVSANDIPLENISNLKKFFDQTGGNMVDALVGKNLDSKLYELPPTGLLTFRAAAPIGIGVGATAMQGEEEVQ
jgi:hypothetical protein